MEPTPEQRLAMLEVFMALSVKGETTPDELLRACWVAVRNSVVDEVLDVLTNTHNFDVAVERVREMKGS